MKWRLLLTLTLLATPCMSAETSLRVMSFNIRYGTAPDGENAWKFRKDLVVETIQTCDPDLVGTQECLDFQARFITEKLPQYVWIGIGREKNGTGEMTAVFYKKQLLTPLESGYFWLSETPDTPGSIAWEAKCPRIVTWLRFKHLGTQQEFVHVNTHFDHASDMARVRAAEMLAKRYETESRPVIITADFNAAAEQSAAWNILTRAGFKDAWISADKREGPTQTFGGFLPPDPQKSVRIDWILYRGQIHVNSCDTITYNKDGKFPSDHYPVLAALVIE